MFAQDSSVVIINNENDILYFNDGKYLECVHTLFWTDGFRLETVFPKYFLFVKCDEELFEVNLVEKMVSSNGNTIIVQILISKKIK